MAKPTFPFTLSGLLQAALETLRAPRPMAAVVIGAGIPSSVLWAAMLAVVAGSVVMGQGSLLLLAGPEALGNPFLANPMLMFGIQMGLLVIMVHAIFQIGRIFGGQGSLNGALAVVTWLQFVLACLQVLQTALLFLAPPLADMLGILGLVLFIWLLTNFVAALHGFKSLGAVFFMILASAFALTFALSLLLTLFGVVAPGVPNV
ncbi:MAG: YIP1 family protein [Rhodobacteraceae bacterium]|nr:YIP1 family protein [Paracoccaceae bacterium]